MTHLSKELYDKLEVFTTAIEKHIAVIRKAEEKITALMNMRSYEYINHIAKKEGVTKVRAALFGEFNGKTLEARYIGYSRQKIKGLKDGYGITFPTCAGGGQVFLSGIYFFGKTKDGLTRFIHAHNFEEPYRPLHMGETVEFDLDFSVAKLEL